MIQQTRNMETLAMLIFVVNAQDYHLTVVYSKRQKGRIVKLSAMTLRINCVKQTINSNLF
ncbi:hypothetical protein [Candidatus Thiothrix anitrata]|uniref:Uncharacterized protein n=1 Tax=Candidatus Thiothrix anitrata TaxID=2823902 RepID=A0ABX7X516_9GAMM|nr:hypothetical protein [Candidatus Thiothrix anitrata]QTR48914.1 hypothetical protein J8380_11555 [Candidatus Thiothrix anitrata]